MADAPPAGQTSQPSARTPQWDWWHFVAMAAIVALFLWMAIWRPWAAVPSWIVTMLALLGFTLFAGHAVTGVWRGAFIDERNKVSLSRFQMLAWTILIISALGTIVIARAANDPATALDVTVDETLFLLMGISTASLVGSPLVKSTKRERSLALNKKDEDALLEDQGVKPEKVRVEGQIVSNRKISDAEWSDLFKGEEVANSTHLDLAKIQMFFFTVLIVLSYALAIGSSLASNPAPDSLPVVGQTMVMLLGISHTGYLANKAVAGSKRQSSQES